MLIQGTCRGGRLPSETASQFLAQLHLPLHSRFIPLCRGSHRLIASHRPLEPTRHAKAHSLSLSCRHAETHIHTNEHLHTFTPYPDTASTLSLSRSASLFFLPYCTQHNLQAHRDVFVTLWCFSVCVCVSKAVSLVCEKVMGGPIVLGITCTLLCVC